MRGNAFVGRAAELEALEAALEDARREHPRVVVTTGPAGIGKTALIRHFLAHHDDLTVATACGNEDEARLAFGVASQLLARRSDAARDAFTVGAELVDLLGTSGPPMVAFIDDADWADVASMQALVFALRRLTSDRLLTLFAARGDHATGADRLARLIRTGLASELVLVGLDAPELSGLSAGMGRGSLGPPIAERLRDHTHGNPLHARTLLEELSDEALHDPAAPWPAPRAYTVLVVARVDGCSPEAERLVAAAAILGGRVALDLAAEIGDVEDPLPALDELVNARLLEAVGVPVGRTIAFPHPLIRAAIYQNLAPGRRAALHERAAGRLEGTPALDHRIAANLLPNDELAADLEAHARQEASAGAWRAAVGHLEAAARLATDGSRREQLHLQATELSLRGGDLDPLHTAQELSTVEDSPRRRAAAGQLALLLGNFAEAEQVLVGAWDLAGSRSEWDVAAGAAIQLAQLLLVLGRGDAAAEWAANARRLPSRDPHTSEMALSIEAMGLAISGRTGDALGLLADLASDPAAMSIGQLDALVTRGAARMWSDDLEGARGDFTGAVSAASTAGMRLRILALSHLAELHFRTGDWNESTANAVLAVSLVDDTGQAWLSPLAHGSLARVSAMRGEAESAQTHAEIARKAAQAQGVGTIQAHAATASAWVAFASDDMAAVLKAVEPIRALEHRDGIDEPGIMAWPALHLEALVRLGKLDLAGPALAAYEAAAAARERRSALASAARLGGQLEAARHEPDLANEAFASALRHLDGLPLAFDRALTEDAWGRFLRRLGTRRDAAAHLSQAFEIYAALGARPFAHRCERELAACGAKRSAPAVGDDLFGSLTPQEVAIATLVADGMTNRQVATELIVSVKTVEYHLGHIFTKLGVESRYQLVARHSRSLEKPVT